MSRHVKAALKGLLDYAIKIAASNLGCMQEIAHKNRQTFYTTHPHPTPSNNFLNSVSVIAFQFVIVYLKSDTAYPLNFTKIICIIFFFSERRFIN